MLTFVDDTYVIQVHCFHLLVVNNRIRNIEIYSVDPVDGRQRFGIRNDNLIAVVNGITYKLNKKVYEDYIRTGSLGDVEIIRSVKRSI